MKKLVFLALLGTIISCSTSPVVPTGKTQNASELDERLKQKGKSLNVSVHGILESDVKGGSCGVLVAKVKAKWNWQEAVNAANSCFKARDLTTVETLANELAVKDTSTPWGPYFMARVALEKDQLDRALWMTELSLKRAPDFGVIHYLKGQILWARKEFKDATACFEKATELDAQIAPAQLILGQVYLRDQEYNKAAPRFEQALRFLPDNMVALNGQAESLIHLNDFSHALDALVRLSELDEADGQYLSRIGALYEGPLNNPERALNAYERLKDRVKSGRIKKNIDPETDSKIKEIQAAINQKRSVASEKKLSQGGKGQ